MTRIVRAVLAALLLAGALGACGTSEYRFTTSRAHAVPSPLAGRCWPLPSAARFRFPYQVVGRYESADGSRWVLTLQWDELSAERVTDQLKAAFAAAGFVPAGTRDGWTIVTEDGYGDVAYRVDPLPDAAPGSVVKGSVRLDLPIKASHGRRTRRCTTIPLASPVPTPDTVLGGASR